MVIRSVLYMFFNALNGLIPFILLPILTTYLSPSDYGIVSLFQTTLEFAIPMIGLSMGFNIDQLFFKVSKQELAATLGNMIFLLGFTVFIVTILIYLGTFFSFFSFTGLQNNWLIIIPLMAGFSTLNTFNLILLRNKDSVFKYGLWQIGLTAINLGLSLLFVISFAYGWEGRALGIVVATVVIGLLSLLNIYKMGYLNFAYNKEKFTSVLKFCFPLLLQGFGTFAIFQSNRYFINLNSGTSAVGIFSVASAFAAIMGIFQDAVVKTINPWFYKNLNQLNDEIKNKIVKMNLVIFIFLISFSVLIYFGSILLIKLMVDEQYHDATSLVFLLTLASAFNGMYRISSNYFINLSKTKLLSNLTGFTSILCIILNYFLIQKYSVLGASYALCIGLFIQFVLTFIIAQIIFPLPLKEVFSSYLSRVNIFNSKNLKE